MARLRVATVWAFSAAFFFLAAVVQAQVVGSVASVEGSAEIGRGGAWTAATPGAEVQQGDELRTGRPGRMRIVFQDDSVVTLADESHLVVDQHVFEPDQGTVRSLLQLLRGKVDALVSDYYDQVGAAAEVKTRNAVAGVRGTNFIVVYDEDAETTEVVGVSGRVKVHGLSDVTSHAVLVTAQQVTKVVRWGAPSTPRRLTDEEFRQYLDGFDFINAGRPESLVLNNPLLAGASVPESERAQALPAPPVAPPIHGMGLTGLYEPAYRGRDAASLLQEPPAAVDAATGRLKVRLF